MFLPGWVSGSQVKKADDCPTQLKHDTVIFVSRQCPEFFCLYINGGYPADSSRGKRFLGQQRKSPFRQHAPEGWLTYEYRLLCPKRFRYRHPRLSFLIS
jgi:hypothetical protein